MDRWLATFCGPANINVYWYVCVMHNYLYSRVVCINVLVVPDWYPGVVYAWALYSKLTLCLIYQCYTILYRYTLFLGYVNLVLSVCTYSTVLR